MNNDSLICFQSSREHLQTISSVPAAVGSAVKIRQTRPAPIISDSESRAQLTLYGVAM